MVCVPKSDSRNRFRLLGRDMKGAGFYFKSGRRGQLAGAGLQAAHAALINLVIRSLPVARLDGLLGGIRWATLAGAPIGVGVGFLVLDPDYLPLALPGAAVVLALLLAFWRPPRGGPPRRSGAQGLE